MLLAKVTKVKDPAQKAALVKTIKTLAETIEKLRVSKENKVYNQLCPDRYLLISYKASDSIFSCS